MIRPCSSLLLKVVYEAVLVSVERSFPFFPQALGGATDYLIAEHESLTRSQQMVADSMDMGAQAIKVRSLFGIFVFCFCFIWESNLSDQLLRLGPCTFVISPNRTCFCCFVREQSMMRQRERIRVSRGDMWSFLCGMLLYRSFGYC